MKDNKFIQMADAIHKNEINSAACIAAASAMDNDMWDEMSTHKDVAAAWFGFAADIENIMCHADEPRFTLYDYLDAAVNGNKDWRQLAETLRAVSESGDDDAVDEAFEELTVLAQQKRDTYDMDC